MLLTRVLGVLLLSVVTKRIHGEAGEGANAGAGNRSDATGGDPVSYSAGVFPFSDPDSGVAKELDVLMNLSQ